MKRISQPPYVIQSISEQHRLLSLPGPKHPLISLVNFADLPHVAVDQPVRFALNFYTITLKKGCDCKLKYGQHYYDFDGGVMSFMAPGQVVNWEVNNAKPTAGWLLVVHPDLLRNYPLGQKIREYGFFEYALHEALHLSEQEETMIERLLQNIHAETGAPIDTYSQDVLIAHLDLLLSYVNRFYNRQFITRKPVSDDLLTRLEAVLSAYVNGEEIREQGLPTVRSVADQLNMSPNYLSDTLKKLTGQSARQHIHNALIERAKDLLLSSTLSVGEIAFHLGFEHSQSFSKLFKQKTALSPLDYRNSLN